MYKLIKDNRGNTTMVQKNEGDVLLTIPFNPDNTDYQAYLKWVEEGNTPEPADEQSINKE